MAADPEPIPSDDRLNTMGSFVAAFTSLRNLVETDLEPANLTGSEFEVLIRLARSPGHRMQMSVLSRQTIVTSSGLTRLIDRLSADGLVRRVKDPDDRRVAYAQLTDAGLQRAQEALPAHLELIERCLMAPLDADELKAFQATLRKVRAAVRDAIEPAEAAR